MCRRELHWENSLWEDRWDFLLPWGWQGRLFLKNWEPRSQKSRGQPWRELHLRVILSWAGEFPVLLFWWLCIIEYKLHFMLSVPFDEKANKCVVIPPQFLLTWQQKPTPYQQCFSTSHISGGFADSGVFHLIRSVCGWWLQEVIWKTEIIKNRRRTLKYF